MQERTGAMAEFENDSDAKEAGYTPLKELFSMPPAHGKTQLSEEFIAYFGHKKNELLGMNRKQRRAWASQQRRSR